MRNLDFEIEIFLDVFSCVTRHDFYKILRVVLMFILLIFFDTKLCISIYTIVHYATNKPGLH